jgi:alpha/beta superfamily hydrolase
MIPEQPVTFAVTPAQSLEGALSLPGGAPAGVVVCHPHPLYGGDMDNPVVTAAVDACAAQGLATLRFNFRGVGASKGSWDEGRGEQDDVRAALALLRQRLQPNARLALAGYSFGASMSSRVAVGGPPPAGLALIAPPLGAPGWQPPSKLQVDGPVLLIAGRNDHICPPQALTAFGQTLPGATVTILEGTDHFFATALAPLEAALAAWAGRLKG